MHGTLTGRVCACVVATVVTALASAGDLELGWWSIDDGGEMRTSGDDYELSGTIGQPDASLVVMIGGEYELVGGFWARGPIVCRGDASCDGQIDFADINPFVDALLYGTYCDGTGANADIDGSGAVGFEDINPFVDMITRNPLPIACP